MGVRVPVFNDTALERSADGTPEGSPYASYWWPTAIQASECVARSTPGENNGLVQVVAGELAEFTIVARDRWGNDRTVGGDQFNVLLRTRDVHENRDYDPPRWEPFQISGNVTDSYKINLTTGLLQTGMQGTTGKYDTVYVATLSGIYDMYVDLRMDPLLMEISGSPFAPRIMSATTSGPDCTVEEFPTEDEPTMAGAHAEFRIVARDRFGNQREGLNSGQAAEGHRFSVRLQQIEDAATVELEYYDRFAAAESETGGILRECNYEPPGIAHLICDTGTGKYLARYQPTVAGIYEVTLSYQSDQGVNDFHISPLRSKVNPATLRNNGHINSWAFGEGLYKGISRKPAMFTIQARDRFNNNATAGASTGEHFTVFITGKEYIYDCASDEASSYNRACTTVQDMENGYYQVTWYPIWVGDYKIQIQLKLSASEEYGIRGSKYDCHVDPDKTHAATSSPCGVTVTGTSHTCLTDQERTNLEGGIAGQEVMFTIQARDEANNPQPSPGGDRFSVALDHVTQDYSLSLDSCAPEVDDVTGQKSWVVTDFNQVRLLDNCQNCVCDRTETLPGQPTTGTGQYIARYTTTVAGDYTMRIAIIELANGLQVNDPIGNATSEASPYSVTIKPAEYNGAKTLAYGLGTVSAIAGSSADLKIQPKDVFGNNGTYQQNAEFNVKLLATKCSVPDAPPDAPSDFICRCGGIQRSPFDQYCRCCEDEGAVLVPIQAPVGSYFDPGQKALREAAAGGPSAHEEEPAAIPPNQFGPDYRFPVQYSVTIAGNYRLRIALAGTVEVIIQDNTLFDVTVYPAPASADRTRILRILSWPSYIAGTYTPTEIIAGETVPASVLETPGSQGVTTILGNPDDPSDGVPAGSAAYFTMFVYDEFDNLRKAGGDLVESDLRALAGDSVTAELIIVECNVTDHMSGRYTVAFVAQQSAYYDVMTTLSGQYLRDPPFKIQVVAATRSPAECIADGPGLVGGQHAKQLQFTIIARDRYGNQIGRPTNDTFIVELTRLRDSSVGYGRSGSPIDISRLDESLLHLSWADILGISVTNEGLSDVPTYGQYTASYTAPDLQKTRIMGGAGYTTHDGQVGDWNTLPPFVDPQDCSQQATCEDDNNCCVADTVGPWNY
eukprot:COSAG02_NODE_105_length_36393_cov_15.694495_18_plen_1122_part_01